ncbi:hypothetical protein ADICYQ_3267 [Cyclobacterium qasimii M12-11B]|nr:hypothetical protein ADICYQ_3267 [Cyclobacterium qasimii M12-11B]
MENKDYECAEVFLKKLIKKDKKGDKLSTYYLDLGTVQRRINKNEKALKSYDKAIDLNSDTPSYFTNRASLRSQQGDVNGALKDYEIALTLDPENENAYTNRSQLFKK